jgi:prepilin peptidase CpaA
MLTTSALEPILHGVVLGLAGIAAFTDVRRGVIPNWLTLPPLLLGPLAYGLLVGPSAALGSLLGLFVCAAGPLLLFYFDAMAGGDAKLFAAIGAVAGAEVGLEVEFLSLVAAAIYALGQLAWNGGLFSSLANALFLSVNPVLPKRLRRTIPRELMHRIRLGAAVLLGASIALVGHHRELWP